MVWGELKKNINKVCTLINYYINSVIPKYVNNVLTKDGDMTTGQLIIIIIVGGIIGYLIGKAIIKCDILVLVSFLIVFSFIIYLLFENFEICLKKKKIYFSEIIFILFYSYITFLIFCILCSLILIFIKFIIKVIIVNHLKNNMNECMMRKEDYEKSKDFKSTEYQDSYKKSIFNCSPKVNKEFFNDKPITGVANSTTKNNDDLKIFSGSAVGGGVTGGMQKGVEQFSKALKSPSPEFKDKKLIEVAKQVAKSPKTAQKVIKGSTQGGTWGILGAMGYSIFKKDKKE